MLNSLNTEVLKQMNREEKRQLADEIRRFLLENVSKTGGHLASNLGVVELTIAMHAVLCEENEMIWDVGHQSYVHKILTGRASLFSTLRKLDGLSGFPKRKESPRDCFDTGHSTTSISAAIGISVAKRIKGDASSTFVVIGDGALTGGMAYESLNHLGSSKENVKIILNDNQMSISRNVGGLVNALRSTTRYNRIKKSTRGLLERIPLVGKPISGGIRSIKRALRSFFVGQGQIFEELGIKYLGKVDGHSIASLERALKHLDQYEGPAILHVMTVKGKGYPFAEKEPERYHGVGPFDPEKGVQSAVKADFSSEFGRHLSKMASEKEDIVAISAAMIDGTGLQSFASQYPDRIFDVGIAEQHAVTFAAGLAVRGIRPFVAIYSTFLQRAYDQIVHDVCLQNLPVVFCIDRAGVVGADGETHHGIFDIAYLGAIPNITIFSVSNYDELKRAMDCAYLCSSPVAIRYPRGAEVIVKDVYVEDFDDACFDDACNEKKNERAGEDGRKGNRVFSYLSSESKGEYEEMLFSKAFAIFTTGRALKVAKEVQDRVKRVSGRLIPVYHIVKIKPFSDGVRERIKAYSHIFTIEDHIVRGGFGDLVRDEGASVYKFGFSDFVTQGTQDELYERCGLSIDKIVEEIVAQVRREHEVEEKA